MYLQHFGLAESPFRITPHTDFFFAGARRGATLDALLYAITHDEGIVKVCGEVGSGKTMLCRVLMERLPESVFTVYLANPSLSREDILFALADELGIALPEHSRPATALRALQEKLVELYAAGRQVVVLIDEAHAMPVDTLEEIRLLSNLESNRHKLLQLVLFGQPELNDTLARPDMRQLRERITHNFSLAPLTLVDIGAYLDFRMRAAGYHGPEVFSAEAVKRIAQSSHGLTRRINILADKALLAAFAAGTHQIGTTEVAAAVRDAEFATLPGVPRRTPSWACLLWAVGGALLALTGVGLWQSFVAENSASPAAPAAAPTSTAVPPVPTFAPPAPTSGEPAPAPVPAPSAVATEPTPTPPSEPPAAQPAPAEPAPSAPNPAPEPSSGDAALDRLLAESRPWLATLPNDRWVVQLLTSFDTGSPKRIRDFLALARKTKVDMAQVHVYLVSIEGKSRYGVVYGEYADRRAAQEALETFPAELRRYRPYPRQAIRLKP